MDARKPPPPSAWQAAIDYGIDVSLLEENLRLTPEERLSQLVAMQRLYDEIQGERERTILVATELEAVRERLGSGR